MFKEENPAKDIKTAETIIGPSVKVEGDFDSQHDIIIDGEVVGNVKTKNNLKVGKGAKVKAEITAKNAYVAGEVTGNITVDEKLHITSDAVLKGNLSASLLMVELGAKLNGNCKMNGQVSTPEKKELPEKAK